MKPDRVRRADFRLADAQSAIARTSGFAGWPALARYVEQLRALEGEWQFDALEVDGRAVAASMLGTSRLLIDGDRFRMEYNFFVIGYSPTERPSDAIVSMAARANNLGLCFIHGATLPDPHQVLLGSGHQTRFIRVDSPQVLDRPEVQALLAAASARARAPFPEAGPGKVISTPRSSSGSVKPTMSAHNGTHAKPRPEPNARGVREP
jgi:hypothetical protein